MANRVAFVNYLGQPQAILATDRLVDASGLPVSESILGGNVYYVDPSADRFDDTNPYTPFDSIQDAINVAQANSGGTILVAPGNYSSENIVVVGANPIRIAGLGNASPRSGALQPPVYIGSLSVGDESGVGTCIVENIFVLKATGSAVLLASPGISLGVNTLYGKSCVFASGGTGSTDYGLNINSDQNPFFSSNSCELVDCYISTGSTSNRAILAGAKLTMVGCTVNGAIDAPSTSGSGPLTISDSKIIGHIILGASGYTHNIHNTIISPTVTGSAGLQFTNTSGTVTALVSNCVIDCPATSGEWVSKSSGNATLISYNNSVVGAASRVPTSVSLVHSPFSPVCLQSVVGIDGKTVGTTDLYTVPTGYAAVVTSAQARLTAATSLTVTGAAGIGVAAGEDDLFSSQTLIGVLAAGDIWNFSAIGKTVRVAAGSIIKLGVDTAYTGTAATLRCDIFGYLEKV